MTTFARTSISVFQTVYFVPRNYVNPSIPKDKMNNVFLSHNSFAVHPAFALCTNRCTRRKVTVNAHATNRENRKMIFSPFFSFFFLETTSPARWEPPVGGPSERSKKRYPSLKSPMVDLPVRASTSGAPVWTAFFAP